MVHNTPSSQDASTHQIWDFYLKLYKRYAPDTIIIKTRSEVKGTVTPGGGGGGGTLIFSAYVGSDPASALHPKKYQKFQAPKKNISNFSNPKKYPQFSTLTLRKDLKMHRNDL